MKNRLPVALSAAALIVAVLGVTPVGHATSNAIQTHFARNANFLRGKAPSIKAGKNKIPAANKAGKLDKSWGAAGPAGPRGLTGANGANGAPGAPGAKGDKGDKGDPGDPATNVVGEVKTVVSGTAISTTVTSFADIPGVTTTVTIPAGTQGRILGRLSGESLCIGGDGGWCTIRILVNATEAAPASGGDFAFDSPATTTDWESHSMDRSLGPLGSGTYTVKAQWARVGAATSFVLDDWSFTVERILA
jgi:hypothetical protein